MLKTDAGKWRFRKRRSGLCRRETAETKEGMLVVLEVQIKHVGKLWLNKSQLV